MAVHWYLRYQLDSRCSRYLTMQLLQSTSCATPFTTASKPRLLRREQACSIVVSEQVSFEKGGQPDSQFLSVLLSWL